MASALLVTGDEDLRVGVQQAQEFGVRVHLVGIKTQEFNQSALLLEEADEVHQLDELSLRQFLTVRSETSAQAISLAATDPAMPLHEQVARAVWESLSAAEQTTIQTSYQPDRRTIPPEIDKTLLKTMGSRLKRDLFFEEKKQMREAFKAILSAISE